MKVHVVLRAERRTSEDIDQVVAIARLSNVNVARAQRFGVVTGDTDEDLEAVRALPQVEAVEIDGKKRAL